MTSNNLSKPEAKAAREVVARVLFNISEVADWPSTVITTLNDRVLRDLDFRTLASLWTPAATVAQHLAAALADLDSIFGRELPPTAEEYARRRNRTPVVLNATREDLRSLLAKLDELVAPQHVTRARRSLASAERQLAATTLGLHDLRSYLTSSKFHDDPTVQVRDVLTRLDEIDSAASAAADEGTWIPELSRRI